MTVCIAWKLNGNVFLASDSRLGFGHQNYADIGVKILQLDVNIFDPTPEGSNEKKLKEMVPLGMCFAGSTVNSLCIKETISEVVKSFQHAGRFTDYSMHGIAKTIFKIYEDISLKMVTTVGNDSALSEIIIAGYCPKEKNIRSFKFEQVKNSSPIAFNFNEILKGEKEIEIIGSGKQAAIKEFNNKHCSVLTNNNVMKTIKYVIDSEDIESVGGAIQYGEFYKDKDSIKFVKKGFAFMSDNSDIQYFIGGVDVNSNRYQESMDDFIISHEYIDPFNSFS